MDAATLAPFETEVETEEQATKYTAWLQAKVRESLDDPGPGIPNDIVMTRIRETIASAKQAT